MTKKDYMLIAASVHRSLMAHGIGNKNVREVKGGNKALRLVAIDLAAQLHVDNPSFDRGRFLEACGVQP